MGIAEAVDGQAGDEFHHQVGQAGLGDAAIDQARDLGMIEAGQELALAAEAFFDLGGGQGQRHHLHGRRHAEGSVGALGQINGAHAAASEQLHRLPRAEPRQLARGRGHGGADAFVILEQEGNFGAQVLIGAAPFADEGVPWRARRLLHRGVKDLLYLAKSFQFSRIHSRSCVCLRPGVEGRGRFTIGLREAD